MRLLDAELTDFRNIHHAKIDLAPRFTALVGENGQGKTNTLEGLYLIAGLRPLRNVQRRVLIREGAERTRVDVRIQRRNSGLTHELGLEISGSRRTLFKDGKKVDASAFIGCAVAVCFTPDDLQLAKGSPDLRRRFLDRALLNVRPAYLGRALRYQKAVRDRNKILGEPDSDAMLDAFDMVIAQEGASIMVERAQFVAELLPRAQEFFVQIANPAPELDVRYASRLEHLDPASEANTRQAFLDKLSSRRLLDRARRTTSVGPHLDDLEFRLAGAPVKDRASQGQHRALVLALKLAEITHLADQLEEPPLLLLDDMSSELDATRSAQLFETIRGLDGQVILTGTSTPVGLTPSDSEDLAVYHVHQGRLTTSRSGDPSGMTNQ